MRVTRRAYELTHECDCYHMPVPTAKDIELAMEAAERLLSEVMQITGTEMKPRESDAIAG